MAEAVSADYGSLFVVNQDDNTIVQFGIGTDGKLYPYNTVNTPGIFPLAIAANKSNLFVVDLYQPLPLCSNAEPCSGSIGVFPLAAASGIDARRHRNRRSLTPPSAGSTGLSRSPAQRIAHHCAHRGQRPRFRRRCLRHRLRLIGHAECWLRLRILSRLGRCADSRLSGSPFAAGVKPSAIASDATSAHVYVTDFSSANVLGYTRQQRAT